MRKLKLVAIDLFSGAGGASTGLMLAAERASVDVDLLAVDNWDLCVETHAANHPSAMHIYENVEDVKPYMAADRSREVDLLWASPECTHHSVARGGGPLDDVSRSGAWSILKWLSGLTVASVIVENVPEFEKWGPLDRNGRVIPELRGSTFQKWLAALRSMGYTVDYRVLCAADYGDPTTRKRLFVQAVKWDRRIVWPAQTHFQNPQEGQARWISAREVIDWGLKGQSLSTRKKPLAEATMNRIAKGIERYWGEHAEPFLVILRGQSTVRDIDVPLPALTAGGRHLGLVEPLFVPQHSCGTVKPVSVPLATVTTSGAIGLIEPFVLEYNGQGVARGVDSPLSTVTCSDRFALVDGGRADITFRMLQPHELARAQGFPRGYKFLGNKSEQTRQIGNAVPVGMAAALCAEVARYIRFSS